VGLGTGTSDVYFKGVARSVRVGWVGLGSVGLVVEKKRKTKKNAREKVKDAGRRCVGAELLKISALLWLRSVVRVAPLDYFARDFRMPHFWDGSSVRGRLFQIDQP